ncbi:MAG: DNA polymerase III subunit gamma/tau [Eubacteriales bacterium]
MYRALYRKWRPQTFTDVCGQKQVTDVLQYQVTSGHVSHAYLFCGSRGTGKTSCAKILARAVNCAAPRDGNPCNECEACRAITEGRAVDVIEMDAASNNGVDNVRDLQEEIVFTPAELKYRVYIIDEVHMMSASAFNALLKTLEEPPAHVLFILATTELQKLPATIVSRCQRFDFRRIATATLMAQLQKIAEAEGIALHEDAARLIARMAEGGMRDAISLLELCAGTEQAVTLERVEQAVGATGREQVYRMVEAIAAMNYEEIYEVIDEAAMSASDIGTFWQALADCYREMTVLTLLDTAAEYLDLTDHEYERLKALSGHFTLSTLLYHSKMLEDAAQQLQRGTQTRRAVAEMTLTRLCEPKLDGSVEALLARIQELEKEVAKLRLQSPAAPQPDAPVKAPKAPKENTIQQAPVKKKATEPKAADGQGTPVPDWQRVVAEFEQLKPHYNGVLRQAQVGIDENGALVLRVKRDFMAAMLERDAEAIQMLLALVRKVAPAPLPTRVSFADNGAAEGDEISF